MLLGKKDISDYLHKKREFSRKRVREINDLVEKRKRRKAFNVEKLAIRQLLIERKQLQIGELPGYRGLDLSFLEMSRKVKHRIKERRGWKELELKLPRFSPYKFNGKRDFKNFHLQYTVEDSLEVKLSLPRYLPELIKANIMKGIEGKNDSSISLMNNDDEYIRYSFTTTYHGIIPDTTKERIRAAKSTDLFDDGIYLIAETRPIDWEIASVNTDPLIVGVLQSKAWLIDRFDITPTENQVSREFTHNFN